MDAVIFEDTGMMVVGGEALVCCLLDQKKSLDTVLVEGPADSWWVAWEIVYF